MPDAVTGPRAKPSYDTTSVADVVIDNVTGLAWQKNPPLETRSWEEAKSYCQSLELGGSSDWRLPTKIELESLVDDTRTGPSIDRDVFPDPMRAVFLSASPVVGLLAGAPWLVEFATGLTLPSTDSAFLANVWCVRTARRPGSLPAGRYTFGGSAGPATVTDTRTGLVWERDLHPNQVDWSGARERCASLGGRWRLPTKKELLTLVDPTINIATPPVIDLDAFPGTPSDARFWSSVVNRSTGGGAWLLDRNGTPRVMASTAPNYVRCVQ
jgi:hypothetical protein